MTLFIAGGLLAGLLAFGTPKRLTPSTAARRRAAPGSGSRPVPVPTACRAPAPCGVTVIIPARDEQDRLPLLLADLSEASRCPPRTIVVDDHSTDETYALATRAGAEVIRAPDLPPGWAGKPWACQYALSRLERTPDDEIVVFLDADVRLEGGAIDALIHQRKRLGGVVSIAPHHDVPTTAEQGNLFFNIAQVMGIGAGTRRPRGLFGPVICLRLGDLRLVGGHASVHDQIVEDLALARRLRQADLALHTFVGGGFRIRMYPEGRRSLYRGWSKNLATGARHTPPLRIALVSWWFAALTAVGLGIPGALPDPTRRAGALVTYAIAAAVVWALARRVGGFRVTTALLFPLPLLGFLGTLLASLWLTHLRGSAPWKGRSVTILGDGGPTASPRNGPDPCEP